MAIITMKHDITMSQVLCFFHELHGHCIAPTLRMVRDVASKPLDGRLMKSSCNGSTLARIHCAAARVSVMNGL